MSIRKVDEFAAKLPYSLRNQVIGYARSVATAAPSIFKDAGVEFDERIERKLIFVAGLRKFYSICAFQYWAVDNSLKIIERRAAPSIKMGSTYISRGSEDYLAFRSLLTELEEYLFENDLIELIKVSYYSDVIEILSNE